MGEQKNHESAEEAVCREKPPGSSEAPQRTAGVTSGLVWEYPDPRGALDAPRLRLNSFNKPTSLAELSNCLV